MSLDVNRFFNKLHYVGNSDCEKIFEHALNTPQERDQIKNELKGILEDSGKIAKPKKEKNAFAIFCQAIKINWAYAFNKSFRHKFKNAVKLIVVLKNELIIERTAKNAPNRVNNHAVNNIQQQQQEAEARKAELQAELQTVTTNLKQKQEQLDELNSSFKKASENLTKTQEEIQSKSAELQNIDIRTPKLKAFESLLKEGSDSSWPWTTQISLREQLKEAYKEIKIDAYPKREFGAQFNQTKADELAKIIKKELEKIPARKNELIDVIGTLQESLPGKNSAITEAQRHLEALEQEVDNLTKQKELLEVQLNPQPTTPDEIPAEVPAEAPKTAEEVVTTPTTQEPAPAEAVAVVETTPAVKTPKDEFLAAIREKVGGEDGQKMSRMFEGLLNGAAITEFTYDSKSDYYTLKLAEPHRKWVAAREPEQGVVLSIGDNDEKVFKCNLSPKTIQMVFKQGITSYGCLKKLPQTTLAYLVNFTMLENNTVKSHGKINKCMGGGNTDNFDEMCHNWTNGIILNQGEDYSNFWDGSNMYPWQARKAAS